MTSAIRKNFSFDVELQEAYKSPDGVMHVVGIASDDDEDRTGERMSAKAINSMAAQANKNKLPLLDNHRATFGFGETFSASTKKVTVNGRTTTQLVVDFALKESYPQSQELFDEVANGNSKKQLSIGGFLNLKNPKAVRFEENKAGRVIRVLDDIMLEHVATTRPNMAAVSRTKFVSAIIKDVFGDDDDLPDYWHQDAGEKIAEKVAGGQECGTIDVGTGNITTTSQAPTSQTIEFETVSRQEVQDGKKEIIVVMIDQASAKVADPDAVQNSAILFKKYPLLRTGAWDFTAKESNQVLGDADWARFKAAHALVEDGQVTIPTNKVAYKFPHHWIRNGEIVTVDRGVFAAMGALLGARGGTNIPLLQRKSVYNHLAGHYREELGLEPPTFKDYTGPEFVEFHMSQGIDVSKTSDESAAVVDADQTKEKAMSAEQQTKEAPATQAVEKSEGDAVDRGLSVLARIGKAFDSTTEKDVVQEEVTQLVKAWDIVKSNEALTEKSNAAVRRIMDGMRRLLDLEAGDERLDTDSAFSLKSTDIELIAAAVVKSLKGEETETDGTAKSNDDVIKTFEHGFTGLTTELAKGITEMAEGFKGVISKEIGEVKTQIEATEKAADERLAKLEKVSGVRQSAPAQDTAVVTGAPTTEVEKSSTVTKSHARRPDGQNPFRGMFDLARNQYMSSHR